MTWLQILYIIVLYFTLAQVLFRYIEHPDDDRLFHREVLSMIKEQGGIAFRIFCVFVYFFWPIVFLMIAWATRVETIRAVTKKLEAMNARC